MDLFEITAITPNEYPPNCVKNTASCNVKKYRVHKYKIKNKRWWGLRKRSGKSIKEGF
jgi:hypothetical protein